MAGEMNLDALNKHFLKWVSTSARLVFPVLMPTFKRGFLFLGFKLHENDTRLTSHRKQFVVNNYSSNSEYDPMRNDEGPANASAGLLGSAAHPE